MLATLPSEIATDDIESRLFDLTALRMQLALVEGDVGTLERHRAKVTDIAKLLEEKSGVPAPIMRRRSRTICAAAQAALAGKTLAQSEIRLLTGCSVVSIESQDQGTHSNPNPGLNGCSRQK